MRYLKAGLDGNVDRDDKVEKIPCELQIDASALKDPTGNDTVSKNKKRKFYCSTPLQVLVSKPKNKKNLSISNFCESLKIRHFSIISHSR